MADTPNAGETEVAPSNGQAAPVTPEPTKSQDNDAGASAAVEKLKADLQAQMRANQIANEKLAQIEKEKEEAERKKLEEDNNYKELLEQERSKREKLEADAQERERAAELRKAKNELLADYPDELKDAASEFGLELSDTSEQAKADYKDKLEKLNARIVTTNKVTPNNPGKTPDAPAPTGDELREILADDEKFAQYVSDPKKYPVLSQMTIKKQ